MVREMADILTPSPHDFTESKFPFHSTSKLAMDTQSGSKLSMDTLSPLSPLATNIRDNGCATLPNGKPHNYTSNNGGSNNNNATIRSVVGDTGSYGKRSNHSSGDSSISSGGSSVNSVFFRGSGKPPVPAPHSGNEYVREPLKVSQHLHSKTIQCPRLYPHGPLPSDSSDTCLKSKIGLSEEVTYTITDEMDDASNQVVFLPPPPTDIDSDNDSVGGCDIGGPCSPRHHDWRSSRDLSKSPTSRTFSGQGNNKCLCCMLLVFVMSTAGLTAVLVLLYLGELQLAPIPKIPAIRDQGRAQLGEGALVREVCETPACLKTSSSILSRMNTSVNPCEDFYSYACGGYLEEADLSWFKTRLRESPDEIIHEHRKYIIDRLSTSYNPGDDKLLASSKKIFRSCLFRSNQIDERTRNVVSETVESLGGLLAPSDPADLTILLANVTRMFGASPFFKVLVHNDKNLSLVSTVADYANPWTSPRDFSRDRMSSKQTEAKRNLAQLNDMLVHLIRPTVNESDARNIVDNFLRLEAHIQRILNTGRDKLDHENEEEEMSCDPYSSRKTMGELQVKYNGFGIDWIAFFQNVLDTQDASDIKFCTVKLSLELQHLLKITPKATIRQFIILHTLIHSDLFILLNSNNHQSLVETPEGDLVSETQEEQCLDLLLHFLPSLEKYSGCDEQIIYETRLHAFNTLRNIREALYHVMTTSVLIAKDNAAYVTNSSMKPVMETVNQELVTRCQSGAGPQGPFDEYSFNSNMLRIIQYHHGEYFRGRLSRAARDLDLSALWISASVQDSHRTRAGPIVYPSPVPQPILYGSLGTFLASRVAEKTGINDLLEHHLELKLNHSIIMALAWRLDCLRVMYGQMKILDYGTQAYKVNGLKTKDQQWKDQLAMQLAHLAWMRSDMELDADHFIPGLTFTRPQMFFIAFAQTRCEKISERGILQHYVSKGPRDTPRIPGRQIINGVLRSSDAFSNAFQCSDNAYMNPMDKCRVITE